MRPTLLAAILSLALGAAAVAGCHRHQEAWPANMRAVAPTAIGADVHGAEGSAVLLVLYASWCHSCRDELPDLEALALRRHADGLKLLAYSLDEDPRDFAEMLRDHPYRFDLVRLTSPNGPELPRVLGSLGGSFRGAIPYVAVFDRRGKLLEDFTGGAPPATLDAVVSKALAPTSAPE